MSSNVLNGLVDLGSQVSFDLNELSVFPDHSLQIRMALGSTTLILFSALALSAQNGFQYNTAEFSDLHNAVFQSYLDTHDGGFIEALKHVGEYHMANSSLYLKQMLHDFGEALCGIVEGSINVVDWLAAKLGMDGIHKNQYLTAARETASNLVGGVLGQTASVGVAVTATFFTGALAMQKIFKKFKSLFLIESEEFLSRRIKLLENEKFPNRKEENRIRERGAVMIERLRAYCENPTEPYVDQNAVESRLNHIRSNGTRYMIEELQNSHKEAINARIQNISANNQVDDANSERNIMREVVIGPLPDIIDPFVTEVSPAPPEQGQNDPDLE